jgi:hypothetical protein
LQKEVGNLKKQIILSIQLVFEFDAYIVEALKEFKTQNIEMKAQILELKDNWMY